MKADTNIQALLALRFFVKAASLVTVGIGAAVMLGWSLNIGILKSILPNAATMKFNTAVCFCLTGASLLFLQNEANPSDKDKGRAGRILAALVLAIGILTLAEYIFNWDIGFDQLVVKDRATLPSNFPGRMSLVTAVCFTFMGIALLTLESEKSQYFSVGVLVLSLLAVIGYVFDYQALYRLGGYSSVAINTAFAFLIMSFALLAARPDRGIIRISLGNLSGSRTVRFLIPASVVFIILLGWLVEQGERLGFFNARNAPVVLIVLLILISVPLIYLFAHRMNQADEHIISLNRLYATLSQVNQAIVRVKNREELYQSICDVSLEFGGFALAWIGILDDSSGDVHPVVVSGMELAPWPFPLVNIHGGPLVNGLVATAIRSARVMTSADIQIDSRVPPLHEQSRRANFHSAAAIPFGLRGRIIGTLSLLSPKLSFFDAKEELSLLDEMGLDISFALENMEIELERQHAEAMLRQSEQKFSTLFDKAAFAASLSSLPDGLLADVNEAFEKSFGFTRQEVIGKTSLELGINPDAEGRARILATMQAHGSVRNEEMALHTKSGELHFFSVNVDLVDIGDQKYILSTTQDITERKQTEQQLRQSEENFSKAFSSSPTALMITRRADGKYLELNTAYTSIVGYERAELIGHLTTEFNIYVDPRQRQEIVSRLLANGALHNYEATIQNKSGALRTVLASLELIQFNGEDCIITTLLDITERKQAEERFRLAVESAPNAILLVNKEGLIEMVNSQTEIFFGYSRAELVGLKVDTLVPKPFREIHVEHRRSYLAKPETRPMGVGRELYGVRKDGTEFPIEIGLTPISTPDGLLVMATIVDITTRKQAEEQFHLAVEAAPNAIVLVRSDGSISLVNSQAENFFRYERAELLGLNVDALIPERYRVRHPDYRAGFLADPQIRSMGVGRDLHALRKDGSEFPVEIGLTPIETRDGLLVMATIVDITERKRSEEALLRNTEDLRRSNAELEQFAYVSSHDLQEPLRMVSSYVQLLAKRYRGRLDSDADEFIAFAVEGATRMQQLINDLLTYSRVGTQGKPLANTDLEKVLAGALANLQISIEESGASITHDPLPNLLADQVQMVQLFQNLIGNAIKFRDQASPRIHIGVEKQAGQWLFSIRDNGIGIDPQFSDRVFVIFQRLHTRAEYPGNGVGLSICKKIVERHGGHIHVEPAPDQGSIFYFTIRDG